MERVRALTDQLEAGITGLFQSGQYAAYLQSLSKLHHYSYGNIFLIKLQCPHASMVAGYGDWKRKFGRHVKAGETGITILAPCPYWARDEVEETGPDGQTIKEQKWVKKTGFTTATVFDVSQTEGRELPSLGVESLTGTVEGYEKLLSTLKSISPVPVSEGPLPPGVHGAYYHAEQRRGNPDGDRTNHHTPAGAAPGLEAMRPHRGRHPQGPGGGGSPAPRPCKEASL